MNHLNNYNGNESKRETTDWDVLESDEVKPTKEQFIEAYSELMDRATVAEQDGDYATASEYENCGFDLLNEYRKIFGEELPLQGE